MSPGRGDISASHAASFKVVKETGMFDLLTLGTKFAQPACHEAPAAVDRYPLDPGAVEFPVTPPSHLISSFSTQSLDKKLRYRRVTARCVVSVEILPTATQQYRNYLYDKSWPNRCYEVGGLQWNDVQYTRAINHDAIESLPLSYRCHKQTDHGRVVDITRIPTTCCGEIF